MPYDPLQPRFYERTSRRLTSAFLAFGGKLHSSTQSNKAGRSKPITRIKHKIMDRPEGLSSRQWKKFYKQRRRDEKDKDAQLSKGV